MLRTAADTLERLSTLKPNAIPAADLEKARGEVKRLTAAVEAERVDLQRSVDVLKTTVTGLEEQLRKTEIRSPMEGIITTVNPADGDLVMTNAVLFVVATRDTYVEGQVNEEDVGEIRDGMHADLRLYSYSQREFTARVSTVLPSTDPNSQRYTVVLYLDDPPENIRAGMTGEMNIIIARRENALVDTDPRPDDGPGVHRGGRRDQDALAEAGLSRTRDGRNREWLERGRSGGRFRSGELSSRPARPADHGEQREENDVALARSEGRRGVTAAPNDE